MNAEEVRKNIEELQSLRTQTRNWKVIMVVGLLAIVLGCVGTIVANARALIKPGPKQDIFMTELKKGLENEVKPNLEVIVKSTLTHIQKDAQEELKKLNDRTPELIEAAQKELTTSLTRNIPVRGTEALQNTFGKALKQQENTLKKDFPNVTEQKVTSLVTNLVIEAEAQVKEVSATLFSPHLKSLENIYASIDAIHALEAQHIKDEVPTWDMAILVFDIMREELRQAEDEVAEAEASSTTKTKTKAKKRKTEPKAATAKAEEKETR
ncbi:MAG: hypothetical protein AB1705_02455 [Verrucomicrobiota bacterium]